MKVSDFLRKTIRVAAHICVYGPRVSSKTYLRHLRKMGADIGEGAVFFDSTTIKIDEGDLHMLTIGKNFQCTGGVTILTHDYGWSVTKAIYGDVLGSVRPVQIGDNVYIGRNAMILPGAKIGNNVIIGANSVVTKEIPDNSVAVGSPCRVIYSIEEYYERRRSAQLDEAVDIIRRYYKRYRCKSPVQIMNEYFWLFFNKKEDLPSTFISQNNLISGSESSTWKHFYNHSPEFNCYEELVNFALDRFDGGVQS